VKERRRAGESYGEVFRDPYCSRIYSGQEILKQHPNDQKKNEEGRIEIGKKDVSV
jgi:hypothetical protein